MSMVSRYQSDRPPVRRISGPLLDRADLRSDNIRIEVPRVSRPARKPDEKLSDDRLGEPSPCSWKRTGAIRARVEAARERQRARFEGGSGLLSNAGALSRKASARPGYASTAGWTTRGEVSSARRCSSSR
jgi:predicted ATPase with chaperone activity